MKVEYKIPWVFVGILIVVLVIGLIINQPMNEDKAIEKAREFVPEEFVHVKQSEFISADESGEMLLDLWSIQLINDEEDEANLKMDAHKGKLIEGEIRDGETGEVLEVLNGVN